MTIIHKMTALLTGTLTCARNWGTLIGNQRNTRHQRQDQEELASEQALLFGQAKRASRERARPVSLAQTGELARRLSRNRLSPIFFIPPFLAAKLSTLIVDKMAAILNFEIRNRLIQELELHNLWRSEWKFENSRKIQMTADLPWSRAPLSK